MNMKISGSGSIPAGEYKDVSISGNGKLYGSVKCENFYSSGSSHGENIECSERFAVSGSSSFSGTVSADYLGISGSFACGEIISSGKVEISGSAKCKKNVKCDVLDVAGSIKTGGDIEAEQARINGVINCSGLLNAESVRIRIEERGMTIGSIGGSLISVTRQNRRKFFENMPLFSLLFKKANGNVTVENSIDGDEIELESVICPRVTGRVVKIGAGCGIGLVQYEEEIKISPDAKVEKMEKV